MNRFSSSACRRLVVIAAISLAQSAIPLVSMAADSSIRVAGQVIFTSTASGGMSAESRAESIQRNLDNALVAAKDRSPTSVNIVYVKGLPVITLGGYQVVTVSSSDATASGVTPAVLASRWADALRNSLRDQSSIQDYVTQLSGGYAASAPPVAQGGPYGGGAGVGTGGGYGAAPQAPYGQPGGPQFQGAASMDQFNRNTYGGGATGGAMYGGGGYGGGGYGGGGPQYPTQRGRVVYAPAGLVLPVSLSTSIATQAAQPGDLIEAQLSNAVNLGDSSIPQGSVLVGQVTDAKAGGFFGRSGMLGVKFTSLRTPDGAQVPITAHIVGGIGKYAMGADDTVKGETWKNKVGQAALRGAIGAGSGAALGTAIGAIAGRGGQGAGRGAWSGTAIGGGLGVVDSLVLRKGKDVTIHSGTNMQVQLDAPVSLSGSPPPYGGTY